MKSERLFADMQLAEMEHNAFKTEASKEKLELATLAYERELKVEESKVNEFKLKESGVSEPVVITATTVQPVAPIVENRTEPAETKQAAHSEQTQDDTKKADSVANEPTTEEKATQETSITDNQAAATEEKKTV